MRSAILMKATIALTIILLMSGCNISINQVGTGSLQTEKIDIPRPADIAKVWDVELDPGSASVTVDADSTGLVNGVIDYNVPDWKPTVISGDHQVTIRQDEFSGIPPVNAQNDWRLQLGQGIPMNLTVNAGAIKGDWELGGLSLRNLDWRRGAADTTLRFSKVNPEKMLNFNIDTGAATLKLAGLANTNADTVKIHVGAGTLLLRFDGALTHDMEVTLEGGAAAITIDSGGNPVQLIPTHQLSTVSHGEWSTDGESYLSTEWSMASTFKVVVHSSLGAASIDLVSGR
jgi:N-terminal domain of toast_rack, DUF2154